MVNAVIRLSFDTTHDGPAITKSLTNAGYAVKVVPESDTVTSYFIEQEGAVTLDRDAILNLLPQQDADGFPHSFLVTYFPGLPEDAAPVNAFNLWVALSASHRMWSVTLHDEREIEEHENEFLTDTY